jgi:alcohol dehydrogenase (cytochrome c)
MAVVIGHDVFMEDTIRRNILHSAGKLIWVAAGFGAVLSAQQRGEPGPVLFAERCAVCHGALGDGGSAPDLSNRQWQASKTDEELERVIQDGVRGSAMPAFADRLNADARRALVRHIRSLSSGPIERGTAVKTPNIDVSANRLLGAERDAASWLMYGHDYSNHAFSPLAHINRNNVKNLAPVWSFQTGTPDGLVATPLFVDGVIFLTTSWNQVFAIDARTGAELWRYKRRLPEKLNFCCGPANRGVSILNSMLYMTTLDAHLVALEARTGRVRWDIELGRVEDNLNAKQPPLIIGNKLIVGIAGGDSPSRGFLDAYDASTGKRLWRFQTIPAPGENGAETWSADSARIGGGATWLNGAYDPEWNLVYWGVGNPYPDYDDDARKGDNLYSDSVVALDADTGKLKWHFQYTPHDLWDWDGVNEPVLADIEWQGHTVKALLHADRNGHFYALDRTNGKFLYAKPFVRVTWAKGFDATGRPNVDVAAVPSYEGVTVCPGAAGGKEWMPMSYSPATKLIYLPAIENCAKYYNYGMKARSANLPPGPSGFQYLPGAAYGKVMAIQPNTGEVAWEVKTRSPMGAGMLATAGGLVFTGDAEGNFAAYDAENGGLLWSYQRGSGIRAEPITYRLDGRQYIAIPSGMGGAVGGYTGAGAPWLKNYRSGDTLYVFALFEPGASNAFHGGAR